MNRKILVVSIIAVAFLVGVSFTSVVGYSSVKSNPIEASPLFTVRTKMAIDEESRDLTCDYVGKGEEIIIPLPKQNDRTELVQKVIDSVSKMDEKTFNRFVELVSRYLHKDEKFADVNVKEILWFIRRNPRETNNLATNGAMENTFNNPSTINGKSVLVCWLLLIFGVAAGGIDKIIFYILSFLYFVLLALIIKFTPTSIANCPTVISVCGTLKI